MNKLRAQLGVALLALAASGAQAATVIDTDFSKGAEGWTINGTAQLLDPKTAGVTQVLSLTQNEGSQTGTAWTTAEQQPASFSMIVDMRIRFDKAKATEVGADANCPADGAALAFAAVPADFVGGGGGSISLHSGEAERFHDVVINTWRGQGLGDETERGACTSGKNETFEFGVVTPNFGDAARLEDGTARTVDEGGAKVNLVSPPQGMKIVDGGFYRYHWNVDSATNTMTLYVTGLEEGNKQFQKVKVNEAKFDPAKVKLLDFTGRWGIAAATGGAVQHTEVARARIEVPMIEPQ